MAIFASKMSLSRGKTNRFFKEISLDGSRNSATFFEMRLDWSRKARFLGAEF